MLPSKLETFSEDKTNRDYGMMTASLSSVFEEIKRDECFRTGKGRK